LPAHPRRVWLGAGHHGRGVLLRVLRLGVPQSFCRPTDGPPWAAGGDRDGCRPYSDRVAAGPNGTPAVAPLRHPWRARRWWRQLSGLYRTIALPAQLVRAPTRSGHERGLLRGRHGRDPRAALAAGPDRARWLACRLLGPRYAGAGPAGPAQPVAAAAPRGA